MHIRENFDYIEGIFDLARHPYKQAYKLVVITNQDRIACGYYTEEQLSVVGAPIEGFFYSPCHPTAGLGQYLKDDALRKPHTGVILRAQKDLSIDLSRSVLIGNNICDVLAGTTVGVGTNLLFAAKRTIVLGTLNYRLIAILRGAIPYLQRGAQ